MNIQQMHIGVTLRVDRVASNSSEGFLPDEIDYYLNEAITQYVQQQYLALKTKDLSLGSEAVNENLRTLILETTLTDKTNHDHDPRVHFQLPSNFLHYLYAKTKISDRWYSNELVTPAVIAKYQNNKYNSPLYRKLPTLLENIRLHIFVDYSVTNLNNVEECRLSYLKQPAIVNLISKVSCDLPVHTHTDIVGIAADKILTDIRIKQ